MLVSLNWLRDYVDINEDVNALDYALTMIGQEVEAIEEQGKNLDNVVIGQVVEKGQHPDAEKLSLCKVNVGTEELQIVCGAPNHKQGDKVVVAKIGAVLPGDFKIKKAKVRGVESCGMMCSEKELNISDSHEGIMILPEDAPIGAAAKDYLGLDDVVYELEITPNRPDCLSHIGIAREIAAYYDRELRYPYTDIKEAEEKTADNIKVTIKDKELSKRYATRIVKGVEIKESPEWLKKKLNAIGIRSINNVVDITNFILMETGHPIHAFDYNKIEGKEIIVRRGVKDEKFVTLDDVERTLDENMLVIADGVKAVALAGVMGGANSEVDEKTTDILIEVAHFDEQSIRKTSKKLGLGSDASYRFERGIDIADTENVVTRAAKLIQEVAGGEILCGIVEENVENSTERKIELNFEKFNKFVGKEVEREKITQILEKLELKLEEKDSNSIVVTPPSFRGDLERTADIYEEIIRMYGFENIPDILPKEEIKGGFVSENIYNTDRTKNILIELGLQEVINYSFIPKDAVAKLKMDIETLDLKNPISEDMISMRPTLLYSLLANIRDNQNRNISDLKLFEVSKVFNKTEEKLPEEKVMVSVALSGKDDKNLWDAKPSIYDFYDLKGYTENLLELLGLKRFQLQRSENATFHPGRSADIMVGKDLIGTFGEIHPDVTENMDVKERVYAAEVDLSKVLKYAKNKVNYKRVVKYPAVERDLAIVVEEDVLVGQMIDNIKKAGNIIEKVDLFDVYRGEQVGENLKSVAINIIFRAENRTLNDEEVNTVMDKILKTVEKKHGGKLRV